MAKKISEMIESIYVDRSADYMEISRDDGVGGFNSRRISPGNLGIQDPGAVAITGGDIDADTIDFVSEHDNGTVSANTDVNWANGNNQFIILAASITITFSNMGVGHKQLRVAQDATGSRIPTLPAGKWPGGTAGSFSTAANAEDTLSIYYDGTNYYYTLTNNWQIA